MRKIRIFDKTTKMPMSGKMPYHVIASDGHFYIYSFDTHTYQDFTDKVIMDYSTNTFDKNGIEVFENDICEVNVETEFKSIVVGYAIIYYDPPSLSYNLELLGWHPLMLPTAKFWVAKVLGNRHQHPEIIEKFTIKKDEKTTV